MTAGRVAAGRRRPVVTGLGLCVLDHLYTVGRLDPTATRTRYAERVVTGGGMVANALAQASRLGCDARVLSAVGDDADGRTLGRWLRDAGVSTRRLVRSAATPTTIAVVLVGSRSGERRFLVPDRRALERRAPDFDLGAIVRGSVLLVDGHFPAQARRALRRAREVGAVTVADFSHPRPDFLRLLPLVDFPIVPREFCDASARGDVPAALRRLARHGGTPVVTEAARGGRWLDGNRVRRYRAHRVRVRDTTGAGDVFHGAFAAAISHGSGVARSLDVASRAAALCCTALGGTGRLLVGPSLFTRRNRADAGAR